MISFGVMSPTEAKKHLMSSYLKVVGNMPITGGWEPSEETLTKCVENAAVLCEGDLHEFLSQMIAAFLSRTGASLGKHPTTPFFANTYLVSDPSVQYLAANQGRLGLAWNSLSSHETFAGLMRADIMSGEIQYLEGPLRYSSPPLVNIRPPVWWILASVKLGRMKYSEVPVEWLTGSCPCLSAMLRHKPKAEVFEFEASRMKDKAMAAMLIEAAISAMQDATYGWLTQHRIATVFSDNGDWVITSIDETFSDNLSRAILVHPDVPLTRRDKALRKLVCDFVSKRGGEVVRDSEVVKPHNTRVVGVIDKGVVESLVSGFTNGDIKKLDYAEDD